MEHGKILFIMGNGPSLKEIMDNTEYLQILKNNHTFGLNAAYRAYEKYNFYPTYFGCFDYIVNESHKEFFSKLVLSDNSIREFYFIGNNSQKQNMYNQQIKENPRFKHFNFIDVPIDKYLGISNNFTNFYSAGASGANALQIGIMKGYRKIVLLGCDCNYIEKIESAEFIPGRRLIMRETPDFNPNYWFNNYQKKGDKYNLPGTGTFQIGSWKNISKYCPPHVSITNCSQISKIPYFKKKNFSFLTKRFKNIYMVLSCKKYKYRQKILEKMFKENLESDELYLFVEGDETINTNYHKNNNLYVKCSDYYEKLPLKVVLGIQYITKNFDFDKLIKVDDDILINFKIYNKHLENLPNTKLYYGQMTPPANIVPGNTWHIGKCSENCKWNTTPLPDYMYPYNRTKIVFYPAGGIYVLSNDICDIILNFDKRDMYISSEHVYEDLNLYTRLLKYNIKPTDLKKYYLLFKIPEPILYEIEKKNKKNKKNVTNNSNIKNFFNGLEKIMAYHIGSYGKLYSIGEEEFEYVFNVFYDKIKKCW